MGSSRTEEVTALARDAEITDDSLTVHLVDGRTIIAPISWYPRLASGSKRERSTWELIAGGRGIHWPDLDEDISVEGLLLGRPSAESGSSFSRWLASRPRTG